MVDESTVEFSILGEKVPMQKTHLSTTDVPASQRLI